MGRLRTFPAMIRVSGGKYDGRIVLEELGFKFHGEAAIKGCHLVELPSENWQLLGTHDNCDDLIDPNSRVRAICFPRGEPPSATILPRFVIEGDFPDRKQGIATVNIFDGQSLVKTVTIKGDESLEERCQRAREAARAWLFAQDPNWEHPVYAWGVEIDPSF